MRISDWSSDVCSSDLVDRDQRQSIALALDQPCLRHQLESGRCRMPGRDPRALLIDGRIHSGGNLLAGLVPLRTGGGETDGRPFPEVKRLLLAQETVVHAPEFGAVGLDREIEAKGIVKLVELF